MNAQQRKDQRLRQKVRTLRIQKRGLSSQNKALSQQASPAFTGGPLSKGQLDQLTKSAIKLKFGGQEQQLQGQIAGSDTRQQQTGDWFKQYQDIIGAAKTQSDQANAAARQQVLDNLTAAQGSQGATSQKLSDTAAGLSKLTGGNFDTGAQTASQANQNTNALSQGHLDALAAQLANNATGFGNRQISAGQQEAQAHLGEAQRKAGLNTNLGLLKGQEGDYGVTFGNQLRQQDLNNQIAQAAGLVKQQQLDINTQLAGSLIGSRASTTKHQSTQDRLAAGKFKSQQEKDAYQRANQLGPYKPAKPAKGSHSFSDTQRRTASKTLRTLVAKVDAVRHDPKYKNATEAQIRNLLLSSNTPPDPIMAYAAVQTSFYGGVGPHTQRQLAHSYGIKPGLFTPKPPKRPTVGGALPGVSSLPGV